MSRRVIARPVLATLSLLAAFSLAALAGAAAAQPSGPPPAPAWDGELLARFFGTWEGVGIVYGNEVLLSRDWSTDLGGHFVRADMSVRMGNGMSFRALSFWRRVEPGRYEVVWMDEVGESRTFTAVVDPEASELVVHYVDVGEDGAPEWRRLLYRPTAEDRYEELLFRQADGEWRQIGAFRFVRVAEDDTLDVDPEQPSAPGEGDPEPVPGS